MAKKFKCPFCGGKNIDEVYDGFRRKSGVISTHGTLGERVFLSSGAEFIQISQKQLFYQCHGCSFYLGSDVEDIIGLYFLEEQKLLPVPKPVKFETYKIKELKHCQKDSLSVRELIDVVNFMNHASGNKLTVRPDSKQPASVACMKFIKTGRPYLFEKV